MEPSAVSEVSEVSYSFKGQTVHTYENGEPCMVFSNDEVPEKMTSILQSVKDAGFKYIVKPNRYFTVVDIEPAKSSWSFS